MLAPAAEERFLILQAGESLCALPLQYVIETMRPLPVDLLPGMPSFVLGLAMIRGAATPVVDAVKLLAGAGDQPPGRYITVKAGSRVVALAVTAVEGIQTVSTEAVQAMPRLLGVRSTELALSVASMDGELAVVLDALRLLPETGRA